MSDKIEHARVGVMDVVSLAAQHDTCVVFPTHQHAIDLWPRYRQAVIDRHGRPYVKPTKTAIYMGRTGTTLRLWIPYDREPTQPMDYEVNRRNFILVSPFSRREAR